MMFRRSGTVRYATAFLVVSILAVGTARAEGHEDDTGSAAPVAPATEMSPPPPAPAPPTAASAAAAGSEEDESQAASQVASFAVTQLKDSPAVVTVISGEDIRASGARDLVDILQTVPGFFMGVDTLGVVGPGFRGLWGYEGKILLMIDGKEMNELLFSTIQLGNEFPVELIERIEVVRGPGSVIYGGNAELSVINVITRGLQGSTDLTATATYGQLPGAGAFGSGYARRRVSLSGRYVFDSVPGLSTFISASVGDGQRSARTFTDNNGGTASLEGKSDLNPATVQLGLGYKDVQATFLYHRLATSTITGGGTVLPQADAIFFDSLHGELVGTIRPSSRFEIVPRFNLTYQVPWRAPAVDENYYDKSARRIRGRLLGRWAALDQLQVTVGGDAIFDHAALRAPAVADTLQAPFASTGTDTVDYQTFAGFVELYSENPIVNVAAGFRYDRMSSVGGALVPRLVLLRTLGIVSLKALFSMSFRAPGIENLNLGTEQMRPEKTRVFEFEGTVDLTAQHRLSANVFDIAIDAPIAYSVSMGEAYVNLGRQGTRGFEIAYRLRHPVVRAEANYSFYVPSVRNNTLTYDVPGHSGQFLGASAHRGSLRATIRPGEQFGVTPSVVVLGPHFRIGAPDASGGMTAVEVPTVALANLFLYRDNIGMPGLRIGVGIYNILGANYRYARPYARTPVDGSPMAATDAYLQDHAPMPGLDREILLQLTYLLEPS